jgi:ABC-type phosphate transport system substrate-binding protein
MRFCLIFILLLTGGVSRAQETGLVVIRHEKGAPEQMNTAELKSVFRGERQRWSNGQKVHIALMKTNTEAGLQTCARLYNMSAEDLKKYWLALVFQGKAEAPSFFNNAAELIAYVNENPGAIGIMEYETDMQGLRIVAIDGKPRF